MDIYITHDLYTRCMCLNDVCRRSVMNFNDTIKISVYQSNCPN